MARSTCCAAAAASLLLAAMLILSGSSSARAQSQPGKRVALDLFVMSKCPDAVFAEAALSPAVEALKDLLDIRLHTIGARQPGGGWGCKHGPSECDGDVQQLCLQSVTPVESRFDWLWRFVACNNAAGMDAVGSFATAAKCMKEANVPFVPGTQAMACIYGPTKQALLEADFAQTEALGVSTSCTIQVEGNTVCVRDGGQWKDCPAGTSETDWLQLLCASYSAKNHGSLPPPCQPEALAARRAAGLAVA